MNVRGHPETLVASHPDNVSAVRHGVYSRAARVLSSRAAEIADEIMQLPHVREWDEHGAAEIGRLTALVEAMDEEIVKNGITRRGDVRSLVKLRLQASRRLQEYLDRFAMTPRGRAEFLNTYAHGGLAAEIARRRADAGDE